MPAESNFADGSSSASEPAPTAAELCPWEVDKLLAKVDTPSTTRTNCGLTNSGFPDQVETGFACLMDARARDEAAEFTVIHCIDCWIAQTLITLPPGALYSVFTEYDDFGDAVRVSRVDSCSDISHSAASGISCAEPRQLFACQGARSDVR